MTEMVMAVADHVVHADSTGVPTPVLAELSSFASPSPFPDLTALRLSPAAKAFSPSFVQPWGEPAKHPSQTHPGAEVFSLLQQMHARALAGDLLMRSDQDGNGVYFRLPPATTHPVVPTTRVGPTTNAHVGSATAECGLPKVQESFGLGLSSTGGGPFLTGLDFTHLARLSGLPSYQPISTQSIYNSSRTASGTSHTQSSTRLPSYASQAPIGSTLGPPLVLNPITPLPRFATQLQSNATHRGHDDSRYQPPHQRRTVSGGSEKRKYHERTPVVKARPHTLKWVGPKTDVMCALGEGQILSRKGKVKLFDPVKVSHCHGNMVTHNSSTMC